MIKEREGYSYKQVVLSLIDAGSTPTALSLVEMHNMSAP